MNGEKFFKIDIKTVLIALTLTISLSIAANLFFGGYNLLGIFGTTIVAGRIEGFGFPFYFLYTDIPSGKSFVAAGSLGYLVAILDFLIFVLITRVVFFFYEKE